MNNNLKRTITYLIYVSIIGFISIIGDQFNNYLFTLYATTFSSLYFWFLPIYPILIGFLIALPQFITNARKLGSWRFDWLKFIIVSIPALYMAFTFIIYFSQVGRLLPVIHSQQLYMIGGIVFGHLLLTSFYKQSQI